MRKDEEDKAKRYTMDDIPVNRRIFRQKVVPTYSEFLMSLSNPFDLHGEQVVLALQRIFNFVFPEDKQLVTEEDPVKFVVRIFSPKAWFLFIRRCIGGPAIHRAPRQMRGICLSSREGIHGARRKL